MTALERLRRERDVAAALREGRRAAGQWVVVVVAGRGDDGPARVAVVASARVGRAVARNRAKRVLREAARRVRWRAGTDVVLIARPGLPARRTPEVAEELRALARQLDAVED